MIHEGKRYYRTLVAKKTLLEERLGLTQTIPGFETVDLAVYSAGALATRSKVEAILEDPDGYTRPRLRGGSLADWARWVMVGFAAFDLFGAAVLANRLAQCRLTWLHCTPLP